MRNNQSTFASIATEMTLSIFQSIPSQVQLFARMTQGHNQDMLT